MSEIYVDTIIPQSSTEIKISGDTILNLNDSASLSTDGTGKIFSPYKSYIAKITQLTTSAPTAAVYQDTLGGTLVWSRQSAGFYRGTLIGAFSTGKVHLLFNNPLASKTIYFYNAGDPNAVYIDCVDATSGSPVDYNGDSLDIEIRVFPSGG